jgi:hypothetical protein
MDTLLTRINVLQTLMNEYTTYSATEMRAYGEEQATLLDQLRADGVTITFGNDGVYREENASAGE